MKEEEINHPDPCCLQLPQLRKDGEAACPLQLPHQEGAAGFASRAAGAWQQAATGELLGRQRLAWWGKRIAEPLPAVPTGKPPPFGTFVLCSRLVHSIPPDTQSVNSTVNIKS